MCKKLIYLLALVFVLGVASNTSAELVAQWKLDDGAGTTAMDASGNGNNGTLQGGPTVVDGKFGQALAFANSRVAIPASASLTANLFQGSFTLTAWINPKRTGNTWQQVFRAIRTDSASNDTLFLNNDGRLSWRGRVGAAWAGGMCETAANVVPADQWTHVAVTGDGTNFRIYVNGALSRESAFQKTDGSNATYYIGGDPPTTGESYTGMVDDLRVYNHVLSQDNIRSSMENQGGAVVKAYGPNPPDGALHADTWVTLSWKPGDLAVSHDVYLGNSFVDVNAGTGGTFRGNQTGTFYVAGFPGFAYPDGLVPGTTYYWRIDEVNAAEPNSPWKGDIWSFSVPPNKAYNAVPADGAKFLDPAATTLSWTAGFGAKLHTVYFGDNYDTVASAAGGVPQGTTSYTPKGPLAAGTTYYWRVDEFDGKATYKGDIWSFTTAKIGGGVKGQYYKGMNFESLVLTRVDPQINFSWGAAAPDPVVGIDSFSVRWTGEVEAAFTETYTFYARADDGVRLWVDGQQLVDAWIDQGATEYSGKVDMVAGNTYSLQMEMYENGGDAVAELRWSSLHTPKQIIPQAALSPPVKASGPNPGNGATGVSLTPVLTWNAGDFAASHDVYFGTEADAVRNATKTSPEYKGSKTLGTESYNPGKLAWYTTYYWRVDEVNTVHPDSPWVGNVWSFTTGDFLLIDDFESYDSGANQIWYAWHDGLGYGAPGTPPYFAGNGTGAAVGDETTASFTEETIVHGGRKSMPLAYDNNKTGFAKYSEAEFKLTAPRDWTQESVGELSLWFRGLPGSVGSFVEGPVGTFTITASGADIWNQADQFHFAYKTLTGVGTIEAQVLSVDNTDPWAKAGVMIRETLDAGSKFVAVYITPGNGCRFQARVGTGVAATSDTSVVTTQQTAIKAPYWVKLERDAAGNFRGYYSSNGTTWTTMSWNPQNITMASNVYIGLALTSHNNNATCTAKFSGVKTTGIAGAQWANQDIGIASNAAEPLYVAVSNAAGQPAVVVHSNPAAAQVTTWTEWVIPLSALSAQGINLTNVDKLAIGLGTRGNMTTAGGSGKMYFDDIRLYRPRTP